MKEYTWNKNHIKIIEDFISQEEANIIIEYMKSMFDFKYKSIYSSERTRYIFPFSKIENNTIKNLILKLYKKSWLEAVKYNVNNLNFKVLHSTFSRPPELVMWTGAGLSSHRDSHQKLFDEDDIISNGMPISSLIYLNDDYDGGELVFDDLDFKVKPKNLSFIMFPSFLAHSVNEIYIFDNKNPRYTIPFFFGFYVEDFDKIKNQDLDFDLKNNDGSIESLPLKG